mgnify:CR=1 FL=1
MILTTSEESRLLDQRAMTEYGLPESVLMENAGASVVQLMKDILGRCAGGHCLRQRK